MLVLQAKEVIVLQLLFWIIIGALAGWIAGSIMGTARRQGLWGDLLVGIVGAIIGGLLFRLFGIHVHGVFWSLISAIIGAVILLWIVNAVRTHASTTQMNPPNP